MGKGCCLRCASSSGGGGGRGPHLQPGLRILDCPERGIAAAVQRGLQPPQLLEQAVKAIVGLAFSLRHQRPELGQHLCQLPRRVWRQARLVQARSLALHSWLSCWGALSVLRSLHTERGQLYERFGHSAGNQMLHGSGGAAATARAAAAGAASIPQAVDQATSHPPRAGSTPTKTAAREAGRSAPARPGCRCRRPTPRRQRCPAPPPPPPLPPPARAGTAPAAAASSRSGSGRSLGRGTSGRTRRGGSPPRRRRGWMRGAAQCSRSSGCPARSWSKPPWRRSRRRPGCGRGRGRRPRGATPRAQ